MIRVRLHADGIDARVRPAAAGQLLQRLEHVVLAVVDGLGAELDRGEAQALGKAIDSDHALRAEQQRRGDRELADRAAAPHRDRVAGLDVAVLRRHVSRRQDVGEEKHLLVA